MKFSLIFFASFCILCFISCKQQTTKTTSSENKTFECDIFSLEYPSNFYFEESNDRNCKQICIKEDENRNDGTFIRWETTNIFPGPAKDFAFIITGDEIDEYEKKNIFYDVIEEDSLFTIDGIPTYSISSIYTEDEDTIIQARTCLVTPKLDMMIVQRANVKSDDPSINKMTDILSTIKFK